MPVIVKSNDVREQYDEAKLRAGVEKSLEKRPVSREAIDEALSRITHRVRILGDREVPSRVIGELVMDELRQLDEVAYVRFASVYHSFQDVDAFRKEIERMRQKRRPRERGREKDSDQLPLLPPESAPPIDRK